MRSGFRRRLADLRTGDREVALVFAVLIYLVDWVLVGVVVALMVLLRCIDVLTEMGHVHVGLNWKDMEQRG
jgi:hypothetical protein